MCAHASWPHGLPMLCHPSPHHKPAGYNLDSLMLRYQGVDWRDRANWACNAK